MKKIGYFLLQGQEVLHFVEYILKRKKTHTSILVCFCMFYCLSGMHSTKCQVLAVSMIILSFLVGSLSSVESVRVPELRDPELQKWQHCGEQPSEVRRVCPSRCQQCHVYDSGRFLYYCLPNHELGY